jgi:methyl-accepting chemotaxis protein
MEDLELRSILGLILPALMVVQIITLGIGLGIGLFSSRKVAVPLYKIERWAEQLQKGNLYTHLAFREQEEMKELTIKCNGVTEVYRETIKSIASITDSLEQAADTPRRVQQRVAELRSLIDRFTV